jgi:hypothetical protein
LATEVVFLLIKTITGQKNAQNTTEYRALGTLNQKIKKKFIGNLMEGISIIWRKLLYLHSRF